MSCKAAIACVVILLLAFSTQATNDESLSEVEWCERLATDLGCDLETGVEVRLSTGTRVDLMNEKYAIECDWASKWAEGCGQALYYAICTNRKAGLLLLLKSSDDKRFVERAAVVAGRHGIAIWVYNTDTEVWGVMASREGLSDEQ